MMCLKQIACNRSEKIECKVRLIMNLACTQASQNTPIKSKTSSNTTLKTTPWSLTNSTTKRSGNTSPLLLCSRKTTMLCFEMFWSTECEMGGVLWCTRMVEFTRVSGWIISEMVVGMSGTQMKTSMKGSSRKERLMGKEVSWARRVLSRHGTLHRPKECWMKAPLCHSRDTAATPCLADPLSAWLRWTP